MTERQMVIDHFMGLRHVHWWWQMVMLSWSLLMIAAIGFAYWLGNRVV